MDEESKPGETEGEGGNTVLEVDEVYHATNVDINDAQESTDNHDFVAIGNAAEIHSNINKDEREEANGVQNGEIENEGVDNSQQDLPKLTLEPKQTDCAESSVNENSDNTSSLEGSSSSTSPSKSVSPRKAKKRGIFVSYAPDASFIEKRFVSYTIKELKNIGFCDDIWFDKDDGVPMESPFCFQQRLEIAEKCRAALLFLSESYFNSRVSRHEGRILLGRDLDNESDDVNKDIDKPVRLFCVNYSHGPLPYEYRHLEEGALHLSLKPSSSVAELSSAVVGSFSEELERYAPLFGLRIPSPPSELETLKIDRHKPLSSWNIADVQAWLSALKMHAHCSLSFEENEIDGYLLLSMTETDMESQLNVDSRVARRKLVQQVKRIQDDQSQIKENWYLRSLKCKVKEDSVYIICDPTDAYPGEVGEARDRVKAKKNPLAPRLSDARLFHSLRAELTARNFQVFKHERLGQSKEEFLQLNATHLAACSHVIILLSTAAATSLFVYNEVLFADWLGKPFLVATAANSWERLRPNMQAILGGCPAVKFESPPHGESVDILLYHLKPFRNMPAVILEQDFLDRMVEGLKPLSVLAAMEKSGENKEESSQRPKIFLSYHWDVQTKVQVLVQYLESHGCQCWTDVGNVSKQRNPSSQEHNHESLQTQIQRNIKAATAVVCCVTPKYICSENCTKDLSFAESMNKPILPILLQWVAWPPEGGRVRRVLAHLNCIDMSNDVLFKKNLSVVETHLKRIAVKHSPRETHGTEHARDAKTHLKPRDKVPQLSITNNN